MQLLFIPLTVWLILMAFCAVVGLFVISYVQLLRQTRRHTALLAEFDAWADAVEGTLRELEADQTRKFLTSHSNANLVQRIAQPQYRSHH